MKPSALVVLSGGQDSTLCLAWATANFETVAAITFDYGQKHSEEIRAAERVSELFGVYIHEIVTVGKILLGTSPLTNNSEELETYTDYDQMVRIMGDRREKTFVPMRNPLFLTLAANRAACLGIFPKNSRKCCGLSNRFSTLHPSRPHTKMIPSNKHNTSQRIHPFI